MTTETLFALASFAFVTAFTPGPNNIMLTASGVNFGFARTIPHMLGVEVGFLALLVGCGLGLGLVFATFPAAQAVLKIAGALYMLWLAWKVANAGGAKDAGRAVRPFTFWQAAAFQWVNPKGVIVALGTIALFVRPDSAQADFAILLLVFAAITLAATATWTAFGAILSRALRDPGHARIFNVAMALLLVASIVPMVWTG